MVLPPACGSGAFFNAWYVPDLHRRPNRRAPANWAFQSSPVRPAAFIIHATSLRKHRAWIVVSGVPEGRAFKEFMRRVRRSWAEMTNPTRMPRASRVPKTSKISHGDHRGNPSRPRHDAGMTGSPPPSTHSKMASSAGIRRRSPLLRISSSCVWAWRGRGVSVFGVVASSSAKRIGGRTDTH